MDRKKGTYLSAFLYYFKKERKINMATFIYPTDTTRVTSKFRGGRSDHHGIDIAEPGNHPIFAAASGSVSESRRSDSYGEVIKIVHNINGVTWETVYAHMRSGSRKFNLGDSVKQGQTIGMMGSTGQSTGQHLHFELHKGRWNLSKSNAVDPLKYLDKNSGGSTGGSTGGNGGIGDYTTSTFKPGDTSKVIGNVVINATNVNMRHGAGTNFDVACKSMVDGDNFNVYEVKGDWLKTKYGWVFNDSSYIVYTSAGGSNKIGDYTTSTFKPGDISTVLGNVVINDTDISLRFGAGTEFDVACKSMIKGDNFNVYEVKGDWLKTKYGWVYNNTAYMVYTPVSSGGNGPIGDYTTSTFKPGDISKALGVVTINGTNVNMRFGAGTNFNVACKSMVHGDSFNVYEVKGDWLKTKYGWVFNDSSYMVYKKL
jgi:uncharacterized protein YgiM (DUF1202 family)